MKKAAIILIIVVLVAFGALAIYLFWPASAPIESGLGWSGGSLPGGSATTVKTPPIDAPTGEVFDIGTPRGSVSVKNFYKNYISEDEGGILVLRQTNDYVITYDRIGSDFWIGLRGDFADVRRAGEKDLLGVLDISEADACKLSVAVGIPVAGTNLNKVTPLSFCGNH